MSEQPSRPKIGVLIYTYDRIDDARINMEIIRNIWSKSALFNEVTIVHAYNGKEEWWPNPYLENVICRTENPGHFTGAELLINSGIEIFKEKYPDVSHVIVLAPDTWCVKPEYLENLINDMVSNEKYLASCTWGNKMQTNIFKSGMALDLFILDMDFVRRSELFPLRYADFIERYGEVLMYEGTLPYLEPVFALRFKQAISKLVSIESENLLDKVSAAYIQHMIEREPIHYDEKKFMQKARGIRHMYWPKLGLITHHDPVKKQQIARKYNLTLGEYGDKFLRSPDLSYFNQGKYQNVYRKNNEIISYNDYLA